MPESKARKSTKPAYTPQQSKAPQNLPPSPPWYGAVILVLFAVAIVWLIVYTLGSLGFQQDLGSWNYLIVVGAFLVAVGMLTRWR